MRMENNIVWHETGITKKDREMLTGHKSALLWFTGLSGSGKSTIATALQNKLYKEGRHSYILDGDNIRHGLNSDLGFSEKDRKENIRRIGEVARLFVDAGLITMATFISPYRKDRQDVREKIGKEFIEIFLKCPVEKCMERDPKGLYKKAAKGEIKEFTGISAPYEEPVCPEIELDTCKKDAEECAEEILVYLRSKNII